MLQLKTIKSIFEHPKQFQAFAQILTRSNFGRRFSDLKKEINPFERGRPRGDSAIVNIAFRQIGDTPNPIQNRTLKGEKAYNFLQDPSNWKHNKFLNYQIKCFNRIETFKNNIYTHDVFTAEKNIRTPSEVAAILKKIAEDEDFRPEGVDYTTKIDR